MTETELQTLSTEDKMKVMNFAIADLLNQAVEPDVERARTARHHLAGFAMLFNNIHQMMASSDEADNRMLYKMAARFDYRKPSST